MRTETLIVGAGVSGLAFAEALGDEDYVLVDAADEVGGYCRSVHRDGFVWDYSGHFFHFRHPEIEDELMRRIGPSRVRKVTRRSKVLYKSRLIDFPFQRHIDQLDHDDFVACLNGLGKRDAAEPTDFKQLLHARYGAGICEQFMIPYNEKVYATDLGRLDVEAMGRFFPHADQDSILAGLGAPSPPTYNSTFVYPKDGAAEFVRALHGSVRPGRTLLGEPVVGIDVRRHLAYTTRRTIRYESLVSSMPLPNLLALTGLSHDPGLYTHNKVLVFNFGFDRKGLDDVHWIYVPEPTVSFYRVGFYDNAWPNDRMSLYVEIGCRADEALAPADVARMRTRALADLDRMGIVEGQRLVASHHVVLDPAYVHITRSSQEDVAAQRAVLAARGVHCLGRYGTWTYCSLEDNIVEARMLAHTFNRSSPLLVADHAKREAVPAPRSEQRRRPSPAARSAAP